jgi:oligoribonuclease NrnB/cAMP/cGMP phosphodiesterase (DHH superfamily)
MIDHYGIDATTQRVKLSDFLGESLEEEFGDFDLTEIQKVLEHLQNVDAIDLAHAESLQQQALRGADVLTEYLGKIVKTVGYLETKVNSTKNRVSLEYQAPEGRTTSEMKKWAGESSPEVEEIQIKLAKAKGSKSILEKKYDILIKSHHHYKEIASGLRKTILGYSSGTIEKTPEGYE